MSSTKEQLLDLAMKELTEKGYEGISLRSLASSCQISHVACYRHFENKNQLIKALLPLASAHFYQQLSSHERQPNAREELIELAESFVRYAKDYPHYFDFLFLSDYALSLDRLDQEFAETSALPSFTYLYRRLRDFHQDLAAAPAFDTLFVQLWAFILGLALIMRQGNIPIQDPRQVITATLATYH